MITTPGGINIFQESHGQAIPNFKFFKSAQTLCHDFSRLEEKLENTQQNENKIAYFLGIKLSSTFKEKLQRFRENYAIKTFQQHLSLFKHHRNKLKFIESIKSTKLYDHQTVKSKLQI